jgi:hypothetical protein
VVASLLAACDASPPRPVEELTVWRLLGSWSGRGLLQTEAFISDTGLLRIVWEARPGAAPSEPGTLRVSVHSAVSGRFLVLAVDERGAGRQTTYVSEDPRSFFLVIEATNLDWTVEAAEGIAAVLKKG